MGKIKCSRCDAELGYMKKGVSGTADLTCRDCCYKGMYGSPDKNTDTVWERYEKVSITKKKYKGKDIPF